jgi:hypothetical protein
MYVCWLGPGRPDLLTRKVEIKKINKKYRFKYINLCETVRIRVKKSDPDVYQSEKPDPAQIVKQDPDQIEKQDPDSVAEPKLFVSAPAPTFKKFRLRLRQ